MTLKEAYTEYREYYKNNIWNGEDIRCYLKRSWIDYEEYNIDEFKDRVLTDDKFNEKWSLGCTTQLTLDERIELFIQHKKTTPQNIPQDLDNENIPRRKISP